jgi:arylsulfatase A-like enzyme
MAPYRIPHFPFDRAIVNVLHDRGTRTSFYHGVYGSFFERRTAFEDMDFDRIVFREEAIDALNLHDPEWTIEDGKLFALAAEERIRKDRFFEFTITGTSHTPFRFSLGDFERSFFPDHDDRAYTYFDTISYVDHVLGKYVDGLPNGTVVFVYGDHWSRVNNEELGYASQIIDEFGIVPAVLFRKTAHGAEPLFEVDQGLARSAKLRLVDVTSWLRESLDIPHPSVARKRKPGADEMLPGQPGHDDEPDVHTSTANSTTDR